MLFQNHWGQLSSHPISWRLLLISALRGGRIKQSEKATEWRKLFKADDGNAKAATKALVAPGVPQLASGQVLLVTDGPSAVLEAGDRKPSAEDVDGDPLEPAHNAAQ